MIVRRAVEEGYVLVTHNTIDFVSLVGREQVHAGLICLNVAPGFMSLAIQKALFGHALDHLAGKEPINEVIEINLAQDRTVSIARYSWPAGS